MSELIYFNMVVATLYSLFTKSFMDQVMIENISIVIK